MRGGKCMRVYRRDRLWYRLDVFADLSRGNDDLRESNVCIVARGRNANRGDCLRNGKMSEQSTSQ